MRDVADPENRARPAGRAVQRYREMQDFPEKQGTSVHPPRRRRCLGQPRGAGRPGGPRGALSERGVPRRSRLRRHSKDRADSCELSFVTPPPTGTARVASRRDKPAAAILRRADRTVLVRNHRAHEGPRGDRGVEARAAGRTGAPRGRDRGGGGSERSENHRASARHQLRRDFRSRGTRLLHEPAHELRAPG